MNNMIKSIEKVLSLMSDSDVKVIEDDSVEDVTFRDGCAYIPFVVKNEPKLRIILKECDLKKVNLLREKAEAVIKCVEENNSSHMMRYAKENFINDVINFRFENIDLMLNRSEILGFDFYVKRIAVIIEIDDIYRILKDQNELILQMFKEEFYEFCTKILGNQSDIVSYIGNNRFVICKSEEENLYDKIESLFSALLQKWELSFKISIGDSYDMPGIEGMGYSFRDAEKYMAIGKRFLKEKSIYSFEGVGIYLVLMNLPKFEKEKILNYVKKLVEYDERNRMGIINFLEVLYKNNLVLSKTEEELEIAKTKAKHMVNIIRDITNLDPMNFEDTMKIYLALKLIR